MRAHHRRLRSGVLALAVLLAASCTEEGGSTDTDGADTFGDGADGFLDTWSGPETTTADTTEDSRGDAPPLCSEPTAPPGYDGACAGNAGCTHRTPPACACGCVTCFDATCLEVACDDAPGCAGPFVLEVPALVKLPFVVAGGGAPSAALRVANTGTAEAATDPVLLVAASGPFSVTGDTRSLAPGEQRDLLVTYTGDTGVPVRVEGEVTVVAGGQQARTVVVAVVGSAALPDATWTTNPRGMQTTAQLATAPFPHSSAGFTDNSVLIVVPHGIRDDLPVGIVLHYHGHNALLSRTVPAQYLVEQFALSGRNAVFVVPQGPVDTASGNFGKLMDAGGVAALVEDVLALAYRDGRISRVALGQVVLTAHSGGYLAVAAALRAGGLPIDTVHLFDALYGNLADYTTFVLAGGSLRSNYTTGGGTLSNNESLRASLSGQGFAVETGLDDRSLDASPLTIGFTPFSHNESIWAERMYARWLVSSGLPPTSTAAPELRSVVADGGQARVQWRLDPGDPARLLAFGSAQSPESWSFGGLASTPPHLMDPVPWVRAQGAGLEATPSDVYGGSGTSWLVVDGFDRVLDGSYHGSSHDFAARVGVALGRPFSSASNEAVAYGEVALTDYTHVLWLLGDEGVRDVTFDAAEKAAIETFVTGGGKLMVSGSEVGYATGGAWLSSVLHVGYVADDAGTTRVGTWSFGVVYEEDYPDVLSGSDVLWTYATGGAAAVGWNQQIVVVGFALETMSDATLESALPDLTAYLR